MGMVLGKRGGQKVDEDAPHHKGSMFEAILRLQCFSGVNNASDYESSNKVSFSKCSMRYLLRLYFRSNPYEPELAHKIINRGAYSFYLREMTNDHYLLIRGSLINVLQMYEMANRYTKALGLYEVGGIESWIPAHAPKHYDRRFFNKVEEMIQDSRLFFVYLDRRNPYHYNRKPQLYLAASMLLSEYNTKDVEAAIDKLWDIRRNFKKSDPFTIDYVEPVRYCERPLNAIRAILNWSRRDLERPKSSRDLPLAKKASFELNRLVDWICGISGADKSSKSNAVPSQAHRLGDHNSWKIQSDLKSQIYDTTRSKSL